MASCRSWGGIANGIKAQEVIIQRLGTVLLEHGCAQTVCRFARFSPLSMVVWLAMPDAIQIPYRGQNH